MRTPSPAPPERRQPSDRRRRPTPLLSRFWLRGQRRGGRRRDEARSIYVDRYEPREWVLILGIVVLSIADLVLTLLYVQAGGEEANPVMAWALSHGPDVFALIKLGVTVVGVLVLLLHIRYPRVRRCVQGIFLLYCLLMLYHTWVRMELPR